MLTRRLAWKRKPDLFALILVVNDQIVSRRLTRKISIDHFRNEQLLAFRSFFELLVNGMGSLSSSEGIVVVGAASSTSRCATNAALTT
jgi:hypothetical protein